jgi:flagellar FliJ protein
MKRFEFRLNKVIEYRKKREEQDKLELAKANRSLFESEKKLRSLKEYQNDQFNQMRQINPNEVYIRVLYDKYLSIVSDNIDTAEDDVCNKTQEVGVKREKLVVSSKARKIVEKLRDRRVKEFNLLRIKWEQVIDDESAKYRFILSRSDLGRYK